MGGTRFRPARPRFRVAAVAASVGAFVLAGCSAETTAELKRLGLPQPASDIAKPIGDLWIGTWIAAFAVGFLVWGLIGWAALRYQRKSNVMPLQNRYNLPMEIFYTVAPFIVIGVLFYYTILAQNSVMTPERQPTHTVNVVGQKWSWTFNYQAADNPAVRQNVWEAGTINRTPNLYLPVNETVRFTLSSPDVIHSFWITPFYRKLDVIPGRLNTFDVTPTEIGVFPGKCTELCGTYHSAMLFNVHVVSQEDYNAYLLGLVEAGQVGEARGAVNANTAGAADANPEGAER